MTFAEQFQNHKCGLVRLRSQLYWYDSNSYDNTPGRVCLLLDVAVESPGAAATATGAHVGDAAGDAATLLLIDGQLRWVWVSKGDVELIPNCAGTTTKDAKSCKKMLKNVSSLAKVN